MKRKLIFVLAVVSAAASLSAYNPPAGGESMYNISSPWQLTSASSCAGGGIFLPGPDSIAFNPALPAYEQRIQLDADFTALFSTDDSAHPFNAAFQTGILIPWKMFTGSAMLNGIFCSADEMDLAQSLNLKAGLSKEITDRISIGMNIAGGFLWGAGSDWALGADLGVLYRVPSLGFTKDFRIGCSVLNLGKYFTDTKLTGINENHKVDSFPSIATVRTGAAAVLFENEKVKFGASFDIITPAFQNVIFAAGVQAGIKDTVFLSVAESIDVRETIEGHANFMPSFGVTVKFILDAKNNTYMKSHSWDQSEMLVSAAWQQRYSTIQAFSGGMKLKLGLQDVQPPVIQLWDGGEDE